MNATDHDAAGKATGHGAEKADAESAGEAAARFFREAFAGLPLMAILRGFDVPRTLQVSRRAWDIGIELVEVPVQSREAFEALRAAVTAGAERGAAVGAGTVISVEQVREAAAAGARFTVAPGFDREVARASLDAGLPHLPGVATASEVQQAMGLGLTWLKAFPAAQLGADWLGAMAGPFPRARFVATGGMHLGNAEEFLDAGAGAVSLGSALADDAQFARLPELVETIAQHTA
ncbi:bifunctional 4-hydroxy-2-oxoglutarate aldolase/2-dehydro-3-deoxy-phosphogluconate aldolase [Streptomyces sp. ODS28]|uniref:bifunctional 4-hydroxy-2-oxoglutarate aldolase/2-dehydro-3-deoxy-phosphogluconate aldolase n=1 Tax=Streptomyces sp. ODS28 TaxID=3136688 RepID=UPI0031E5F6FB